MQTPKRNTIQKTTLYKKDWNRGGWNDDVMRCDAVAVAVRWYGGMGEDKPSYNFREFFFLEKNMKLKSKYSNDKYALFCLVIRSTVISSLLLNNTCGINIAYLSFRCENGMEGWKRSYHDFWDSLSFFSVYKTTRRVQR